MTEEHTPIPGSLNNVVKIDDERISGHLDRVVRGTVEETLNALLDAEADRLCNAQRYERTDARRDTRAGHYERSLETKAGEVTLKVPKLRRPIHMSNAAKAFVWSAEYQPWGAVQSLSGPLTLDLRFPGQWFQLRAPIARAPYGEGVNRQRHQSAGLHYNWHRHYDASLGRYTQADPLGFVDGPSVYGYVRGAPYRYVDKDGRVTYLVTNSDGLGHTALIIIGDDGSRFIYDPGGSYPHPEIGSGRTLSDSQVNITDFLDFQGPDTSYLPLPTTPGQERKIMGNIDDEGGCVSFLCTQCTSNVLRDTSDLFKDLPSYWWPGSLRRELLRRLRKR